MLEKRRVGKLGAASLVVSLPAAWTRLTGIKKGDEIYAYQHGLSLVITPRERKRERGSAEIVLVDAHGAMIEVFARYIQGFDAIRVVDKAPEGELEALLEAVDSHLLGVQVLEQSREATTLHVFTREHASLPRLFKRLQFVVKSLSALIIQELRSPKFNSAQIKTLTKSAFKLYFLVLRLVYGASRGSRDLAEARLSFGELLSFALAAKNICGVLDSVTTLVRATDDLNAPFKQDEALIETVARASKLYLDCLAAFLEKEKIDFGDVRHERRDLIRAAESHPTPPGLMEGEARVLRDTRLLAREFADRAGELMELAANIEGLSD
jgi:phosphate uptake regulator